MRRLRLATLVVLCLPGAALAAPELSLDLGAGGGWEQNLSHSPAGETKVAGWAANATATVGVSADIGRDFLLFVNAGYGGTFYLDTTDLTAHMGSVGARVVWLLGDRFRLALAPWGGYRFYGDAARSGWAVSGRADASVLAARWLEVGVHYRRSDSFARDETFSAHADAVGGTLRFYLGRPVTLRLGYQLELGQDVTYVPVLATPAGTGSGSQQGPGTSQGSASGQELIDGSRPTREVTTFGTSEVAVRIPATFHTATAAVTWRVTRSLSLDAWYTFVHVVSDRPYDDQLAGAGVSWRF